MHEYFEISSGNTESMVLTTFTEIGLTMKCLHGEPAAHSTTQNGSFWFCNQKKDKVGMANAEGVWRIGGSIVSRTSLCLHKLIQTRIDVWNNLFLIEYNNIIQISGI